MELLQKLFHGKGYIDGITVINLEGEILFSAKMNGKLHNSGSVYELVGKNFFDIYENLTAETSSTIRAMELGLPVYVENQFLKTQGREGIRITSLSLPIKSGDRIVGAIDLSLEEGDEGQKQQSGSVSLEAENVPIGGSQKLLNKKTALFTAEDIIAVDEKMVRARDYIQIVASCDLPVMIYGETGTGKEVFAQAIHNAGSRREKPFIAQNCAALPDTLLESILFGTSKGAFTGAVENKGLFELGDGGTLFLDEINSMPIHLQSKLLRVLQDGQFRSLGAREVKKTDVKIIAAINKKPLEAIQDGELRRDIYYRLSMMSITIPPLRERKKDIVHFIKFYVNKHNHTFGKNIQYVSKELIARLEDYSWPGNVRELEHMIVYGMSMADPDSSMLRFEDIEDKFLEKIEENGRETSGTAQDRPQKEFQKRPGTGASGEEKAPDKGEPEEEGVSLKEALEKYEKRLIEQALTASGGNISRAAKRLSVPRQTLQRKVKQYGISCSSLKGKEYR